LVGSKALGHTIPEPFLQRADEVKGIIPAPDERVLLSSSSPLPPSPPAEGCGERLSTATVHSHQLRSFQAENDRAAQRTRFRLYAKELLMHFVGLPADQLLERMVELSLRTEEHL
jgi:hypothetical protein